MGASLLALAKSIYYSYTTLLIVPVTVGHLISIKALNRSSTHLNPGSFLRLSFSFNMVM